MKNKIAMVIGIAALCVPIAGYAECGSQTAWECCFFAALVIMALEVRLGAKEAASIATGGADEATEDEARHSIHQGLPEAIGAGLLGIVVFIGSGMAEIPIQHAVTFGAKEIVISGIVIPLLLMASSFLMGKGIAEALKWMGACIYFVRHRRHNE